MRTHRLRKPAALAASLALLFAVSACADDDTDTTDPLEPVPTTATTLIGETTTTPAG